MKYKDYEGSIEELVRRKLTEIEEKEQVKVLHAVESGSRAWGLASPDSDYDVRFVYVRPMEYYLRLNPGKDFIDWELDETLDINGWDLRKVLQHFHKSNAVMYEWANSPVVYGTTPEWEHVREAVTPFFSCKLAMYHYYGTANKNYLEYLTEDRVRYKKYFYVLRPLLACRWIEQKACPPPVLFQELTDTMLEEDMKAPVQELMQKKMQMAESEKGVKAEQINEYIAKQLAYFKQRIEAMEDDRKADWQDLNRLFLSLVFRTGEGNEMNNLKNMWDFPVKEGVSFQNVNRVHPLMQARVEKLIQHFRGDENVKRVVLFGSSLEFRCSSGSDIDLYIDKFEKDRKLHDLPELDCEVDIVMDLSPDSSLYREIDRTGLILFER